MYSLVMVKFGSEPRSEPKPDPNLWFWFGCSPKLDHRFHSRFGLSPNPSEPVSTRKRIIKMSSLIVPSSSIVFSSWHCKMSSSIVPSFSPFTVFPPFYCAVHRPQMSTIVGADMPTPIVPSHPVMLSALLLSVPPLGFVEPGHSKCDAAVGDPLSGSLTQGNQWTMLPHRSAMSSTTSDLGNAVRPNGTLKDASDMDWTFNTDEDLPFPSGIPQAPCQLPLVDLNQWKS
ncbi:hypothetical protein EI94DRAFT_1707731 [Lactarius quietus]|nr:hypothetical protein EI94DRAFT_1707731 [Lactarius quietus]